MNIKTYKYIFTGLLIWIMAGNLYAGSISSAGVWLNRYQDESLNTYYAFYTDIYGTVSEFQSITLTTPLGNTYPLGLSPEGDQWGSGIEGTQADITSEFTNGIYRFDVTYTDASTDSINIQLGGVLPTFPTALSLTGNTVTWDSWLNPIFPLSIELDITNISSGERMVPEVPFTDTSYVLPDGFLQENDQYKIILYFVSSQYQNGIKASISTITTNIFSSPVIDIKPGSDPNCFNINDHGVIPVAILGSEDFDVSEIDLASLLFGGLQVRVRGNKGPLCSIEYSNEDVYHDLVCHFEDDTSNWSNGSGEATLFGNLIDGTPFEGKDSICIVP